MKKKTEHQINGTDVDPALGIDIALTRLKLRLGPLEQKVDFVRGIALGLFYGIVGNLLVSYFHGLFQGLVAWQFDVLFWGGLDRFCGVPHSDLVDKRVIL